MTDTKTSEAIVLDAIVEAPAKHNAPALKKGGALAAAPDGPMADAIAFLRAGGTVAELRDMLQLQREWKADQAKQAYTDAMAVFKENPPKILKDKRVYFESSKPDTKATDYWHATLGNVTEAIIEGLAKVGISHSWKPERKGDRIHVTCTLTHKLGHSESVELDGPLDASGLKNNIQQMASTTTYLSRYTLLLITGLAVQDKIMPDNDGKDGAKVGDISTIDPDLLQRARDASMLGWQALAKFTKEITEAQRTELRPVSASLKAAAKGADEAAIGAKP